MISKKIFREFPTHSRLDINIDLCLVDDERQSYKIPPVVDWQEPLQLNKKILIVLPSVPMAKDGDGFFMDIKAVDGLRRYCETWPGPVKCLMRLGDISRITYGQTYAVADLPFSIQPITDNLTVHKDLFENAAVILASGDNHHDLDIGKMTNTPVVFIIEYTLATRLRILQLEKGLSFKTVKSTMWNLLTERKRRAAFALAVGLQANGKPAFNAYQAITRAPTVYFDNRMTEAQLSWQPQMAEKSEYCISGQPLRMAFSGRLERMKGVDHLIPVLQALASKGLDFTFDFFGSGSLEGEMRSAVKAFGLENKVFFHGPVSFDEVLVPHLKQRIDLFVCCHRQSDPSCTYIETLGCGVPIVGYDNAAFRGVLDLGDVGVRVSTNKPKALADAIITLDRDRARLAAMAKSAIAVASQHSFEATFARRIEHLGIIAL
jgi:colanic acid/amylovoran biosynthesis glycosyltransferase